MQIYGMDKKISDNLELAYIAEDRQSLGHYIKTLNKCVSKVVSERILVFRYSIVEILIKFNKV